MRIFLDACVLFPTATRSLLLSYARAGGFTPLWSARVLEEWRRATLQKRGEAEAVLAEGDMALMGAWFPGGLVEGWERLEDEITPPDPADAHVIAAARAGEAEAVLTFNIRDFPQRLLAPVGLSRLHPDEYLRAQWLRDQARLEASLEPTRALAEAKGMPFRAFLKRANLPRLGKAIVD
ncbi:MAG: PIN domain-containing protein [Pseudomonadota bacterium]